MINLNDMATRLTLQEGLKKSVSIAQVKEILRLVLKELKVMSLEDVAKLLARIR